MQAFGLKCPCTESVRGGVGDWFQRSIPGTPPRDFDGPGPRGHQNPIGNDQEPGPKKQGLKWSPAWALESDMCHFHGHMTLGELPCLSGKARSKQLCGLNELIHVKGLVQGLAYPAVSGTDY